MITLDEIDRFEVFFETLEVGQRFVSQRRTVTETDIVNFAGLSGDYNALHMDAIHAAETSHGERIAHGLLVLAIVSGLSSRLPVMRAMERTLIGLTNLQVRWRRPTRNRRHPACCSRNYRQTTGPQVRPRHSLNSSHCVQSER